MNKSKTILNALIDGAKLLGLRQADIKNANGLLEYGEYYLCFDTVITQLYEYDIKIDEQFYLLVTKSAVVLKINENEFLYLKELISNDQIPKSVRAELTKIIGRQKDDSY